MNIENEYRAILNGNDSESVNTGSTTQNTTGVSSGTSCSFSSCSYRLPCGYCTMLCRPCPMGGGIGTAPPWKRDIVWC